MSMSSLESTDPMSVLPHDVCVRILMYLDNADLNNARLVGRLLLDEKLLQGQSVMKSKTLLVSSRLQS